VNYGHNHQLLAKAYHFQWNNNYICVPTTTPYRMNFFHYRPKQYGRCVQWKGYYKYWPNTYYCPHDCVWIYFIELTLPGSKENIIKLNFFVLFTFFAIILSQLYAPVCLFLLHEVSVSIIHSQLDIQWVSINFYKLVKSNQVNIQNLNVINYLLCPLGNIHWLSGFLFWLSFFFVCICLFQCQPFCFL